MVIAAALAGLARVAVLAAAHPGRPGRPGPPGSAAVSRRAGQQLARIELSKAIYHPSVPWSVRLERWIARFLNAAGQAVPGGWWALVALAALVVIGATIVLARIGPVARSRRRAQDPIMSGAPLSACDHRQNAERLAGAGDFTAAIIESVRAIAAELEERSILPPRPGRTAGELAAEAIGPLPTHASGFGDAARLFDDVRYGGRAGTADGYQRLRDLDAGIRAARPAVSAAPRAGATAGAVS
jgi:Domain of unknown function (DUF4129)